LRSSANRTREPSGEKIAEVVSRSRGVRLVPIEVASSRNSRLELAWFCP
jgi:hypothetical protein